MNLEFVQSSVLAFIQGATEFLPISSSAHLILLPTLFGWNDQGLAFDIAVHVGTLVASVAYFKDQIYKVSRAWVASLFGGAKTSDSNLAWFIIIASVPVAVAGGLAWNLVQTDFRTTTVIGLATLIFGLLLWFADHFRRGKRQLRDLRLTDAILIGIAQAIAIIPGTSRSGIAITVGLMLGLSRKEAARFAFLLAIPVIAMAGGWQLIVVLSTEFAIDWRLFGVATLVSATVAYLSIHYFLAFIEKVGMLPFVIYRLVLGFLILAVLQF